MRREKSKVEVKVEVEAEEYLNLNLNLNLDVRRDRGFTLLELLVVLFIMGLGLAFVLPSVSRGLEGLSLTAAAREMAAVYRGAREEAVARQETKVALLSVEGDRVAMRWDHRERLLPQGVRVGVVRPETLRNAEGIIALEFYPDGSSSGGVLLIEGASGRLPLWVRVDAVTGRVKIARGEG